MSELIRLSKLMSQRGISSRREADRLIEQGLVLVDGKKIDTLGTKVSEDAEVRLAKRGQEQQQRQVIRRRTAPRKTDGNYLLLHVVLLSCPSSAPLPCTCEQGQQRKRISDQQVIGCWPVLYRKHDTL